MARVARPQRGVEGGGGFLGQGRMEEWLKARVSVSKSS